MSELFDLSGRVALVTGTSRGLGQYFARALARAGADLAISSRDKNTLAAFAAEIEALGRKAFSVSLDVRDHSSIQQAVAAVEEHYGKIDILVNNAGCNIRKPALDVTWEDWNTILDTNLRGSFFVAQAVARGMIERGYGRIVNIGSVTSVCGFAGLAPYGASRGGIKQLTMSLADDWGRHGVTVNCLAPGWFQTQQNRVLYENAEWVKYICRPHSSQAPRPARRSGWCSGLSGLGVEPLHHRADAAGGWRGVYGGYQGDGVAFRMRSMQFSMDRSLQARLVK